MKSSELMVDTGHMVSVCQELSSADRLRGRGIDMRGGRDLENLVSGCQAGSMGSQRMPRALWALDCTPCHGSQAVGFTFPRVSAMQGPGETIVPHSVGFCEGKIASDTEGKHCSLCRVAVIL